MTQYWQLFTLGRYVHIAEFESRYKSAWSNAGQDPGSTYIPTALGDVSNIGHVVEL